MRIGMVVVGVVLLLIGAVLLFVPIASAGSQTATDTAPDEFQISGFSITGSTPISVSWTSNTSIALAAAACSGNCNSNVSTLSGVVVQTGTSGTFTLSVPSGGTVAVAIISESGGPAKATLNVTTAETSIGSILLIVGILLLIVGLVLKRKGKAMGASASMPAQDNSAPMAPPNQ